MMEFIRKCILLLGVAVALPFWAYGVVGLIKRYDIDSYLATYLNMSISSNGLKSIIYLVIGSLLAYALKVLSDRIR